MIEFYDTRPGLCWGLLVTGLMLFCLVLGWLRRILRGLRSTVWYRRKFRAEIICLHEWTRWERPEELTQSRITRIVESVASVTLQGDKGNIVPVDLTELILNRQERRCTACGLIEETGTLVSLG